MDRVDVMSQMARVVRLVVADCAQEWSLARMNAVDVLGQAARTVRIKVALRAFHVSFPHFSLKKIFTWTINLLAFSKK